MCLIMPICTSQICLSSHQATYKPMTNEQRDEITRIAKEFASGFEPDIPVSGSGWLIADPLSGYLNSIGHKNTLTQIPANDQHPQVLLLNFTDGSVFALTGGDLEPVLPGAHNFMWAAR